MKEYIFYSPKMSGEILFKYDNEDGAIRKFEIIGELSTAQFKFLIANFPFTEQALINLTSGKNNQCKIKEVEPDLSFERFWDVYGYKKGKRKMAENSWSKKSKAEKVMIIEHIPKYKKQCGIDRVDMAYPSTYLNQEYYKN